MAENAENLAKSLTEECNCSKLLGSCLDIATPVNLKLTGYFKRSFAHYTVKSRWPVMLTKLIDNLVRNKADIKNLYGEASIHELKNVIGELAKLKHDIQTNKQMTSFDTQYPDAITYNTYIKKTLDENCQCSFYNTLWLFSECYMYRRIFDIFLHTEHLKEYDYFAKQKYEAFEVAMPLMKTMGNKVMHLIKEIEATEEMPDKESLRNDFYLLVQLNLWGNKCDLSLSGGVVLESHNGIFDNLAILYEDILCDDSAAVYAALCRNTMHEIVDFVCDNAGYELFTDFCLADWLITHKFAKKVRFFVKKFPWFISDVTKSDFHWILDQLKSCKDENLVKLGNRWIQYIKDEIFIVLESYFWTTHLQFSEMFENDEQLFRSLARSKCTFYKGDLNYRKLLGDRNWDPTTPFQVALEGYHPSRLCALRTLKADLICGLRDGLAKEMDEKDPDWMISGKYGVIQYCGKVKKLI